MIRDTSRCETCEGIELSLNDKVDCGNGALESKIANVIESTLKYRFPA